MSVMKLENIDWSVLRGALITFLTVGIIAVAVAVAGYFFYQSMYQDYRSAQSQFNRVSDRYLKVDEEEALIKKYYPAFKTLYEQGIIGSERRLDWLESLQQVTDSLEIPGLRYEIGSRQMGQVEWPIETGAFELYSSNMKVNLDMLHELDLLRLLDRMERLNTGFFSVSDCDMKRSRSIDTTASEPNVSASCNIKWYSLALNNGEELEL